MSLIMRIFTCIALFSLALMPLTVFSKNTDAYKLSKRIEPISSIGKLNFSVSYPSFLEAKIEIQRHSTAIGFIEVKKTDDGNQVSFVTPSGSFFGARVIRSKFTKSSEADSFLVLSSNSQTVTLSMLKLKGKMPLSSVDETQLRNLMNDVRQHQDLARLMTDAKTISTNLDNYGCAKQITACIVAVMAMVGGYAVLATACPETLGATCVVALVAHPALSTWVGFQCADAVRICKTPPDIKLNSDDWGGGDWGFDPLIENF